MTTAEISVRVEPELKDGATKVFEKLGISESDAINRFLREVVTRQQLPFGERIPNRKTLETMEKTDSGEELTEYGDIGTFYREMGIPGVFAPDLELAVIDLLFHQRGWSDPLGCPNAR